MKALRSSILSHVPCLLLLIAAVPLLLLLPAVVIAEADDEDTVDLGDGHCQGENTDGLNCEKHGCSGNCLGQACRACDAAVATGNSCAQCGFFEGLNEDGTEECTGMFKDDGSACTTGEGKAGKCKTSEGPPPAAECVPTPTPTPKATPVPACGAETPSHTTDGCPAGKICCFTSRDPGDSSKSCVDITNSCPPREPCVSYIRDGNCPCLEVVRSNGSSCTTSDNRPGTCQSKSCVPTPTPTVKPTPAKTP